MKHNLGPISVSVQTPDSSAKRNPTRNRWVVSAKQERCEAGRSGTVAALSSARSGCDPSCSEWCAVDCRIDSAAAALPTCSCINFCCAAPLVTCAQPFFLSGATDCRHRPLRLRLPRHSPASPIAALPTNWTAIPYKGTALLPSSKSHARILQLRLLQVQRRSAFNVAEPVMSPSLERRHHHANDAVVRFDDYR